MTRRLPLLFLLVLTGCGGPGREAPATASPSRTPEAPPDRQGRVRQPDEGERAIIRRLQQVTERTRGLTFARPVPVEIQDQVRISAQLSAMIEEEDLAEARVVYSALGLIDPEVDLRSMIERLAGEQVVGYYDPEAGQLVVRDDVMDHRLGPEEESSAVLVHELVHALQDQRLGLGETYDLDRETDAGNAFDAVVEGDATLAMLAYVLEQQGAPLHLLTQRPGLLKQAIAEAPLTGMELGSAPPIVRVTLIAPYVEGLMLCAALHGAGGWEAIDRAHADPPVSTEQVLHPEKYLAREAPVPVELPELPSLREAGLEPLEDDTLGELEMGVYLAQHRPDLDADRPAAAGWGGDRLRVYRDGADETVSVWFSVWDDEAEAREAAGAARAVRDAVPAPERKGHVVARSGRALLIVRNLDPALQDAVREAFQRFARAHGGTAGATRRGGGELPPARASL